MHAIPSAPLQLRGIHPQKKNREYRTDVQFLNLQGGIEQVHISIPATGYDLSVPLPELPASVTWSLQGGSTHSSISDDVPEAEKPQHVFAVKLCKYIAYRYSYRITTLAAMQNLVHELRSVFTGGAKSRKSPESH